MSQIPKLQFLVMEARDLPAGDKNGFSDPYVILKWKEHKFKTRVIPKTLDPVWNETIELNGIGEHDILEIEVKDKVRIPISIVLIGLVLCLPKCI